MHFFDHVCQHVHFYVFWDFQCFHVFQIGLECIGEAAGAADTPYYLFVGLFVFENFPWCSGAENRTGEMEPGLRQQAGSWAGPAWFIWLGSESTRRYQEGQFNGQ